MSEVVTLPARLDVTTVGDLAILLRQACRSDHVQIDASDVTHLSALGTQLLLSTARTVRSKGGSFELSAISERAQTQLAAMGLTPETLVEGAL